MRYIFYSFIALILVSSTVFLPVKADSREEIVNQWNYSDYHLKPEVSIGIVFIDWNQLSEDEFSTIDNYLEHTYASTVITDIGFNLKPADMGFQFQVNYEYIQTSTSHSTTFFEWMDTQMTTVPASDDLTDYDNSMVGETQKIVDAETVDEWLYSNRNSLPIEAQSCDYLLYFINSENHYDYYYNYVTELADPDTGSVFSSYMISWGGDYRSYFIDITTAPIRYEGFGESVNWINDRPLKDYPTDDLTDLLIDLAEYIDESTANLFLGAFLYYPVYKPNFRLQILLVDATSDNSVLTHPEDYIDISLFEESYRDIVPYVNWSFMYNAYDLDNESIFSEDIRTAVLDGETLDSDIFIKEGPELFPPGDLSTIPLRAIVVMFDDQGSGTDREFKYIEQFGVIGIAQKWGAIMVGMEGQLENDQTGLSLILIHEIGHFLGFRHPHDGYDEADPYPTDDTAVTDWLYDFSSTPMTYALPFRGEAAGRAFFNQLNRDVLERGHTSYIVREARRDLRYLVNKLGVHENCSELPESAYTLNDEMITLWTNFQENFYSMNYYQEGEDNDALDYALKFNSTAYELIDLLNDYKCDITESETDEPTDEPIYEETKDDASFGWISLFVAINLLTYAKRKKR